jgi:2-polyprenyl-6-hydroxyphenyl methylase/3-demethylubiquinone-9 3-methyltransferase
LITACARLVRPGGHVFLSTLNRNPKSFLFAIVGAEYVLKILPRGIHNYNRFLKPSELARFCRDAGLMTTSMSGLTYNPFTRTYSLSRDTSVNYLVQTRRPA